MSAFVFNVDLHFFDTFLNFLIVFPQHIKSVGDCLDRRNNRKVFIIISEEAGEPLDLVAFNHSLHVDVYIVREVFVSCTFEIANVVYVVPAVVQILRVLAEVFDVAGRLTTNKTLRALTFFQLISLGSSFCKIINDNAKYYYD